MVLQFSAGGCIITTASFWIVEVFWLMRQMDSAGKIITRYLAAVSTDRFVFRGVEFVPQPLQLSPMIFRQLICPPDCGACCGSFSLDWLSPPEGIPTNPRELKVNGESRLIHSAVRPPVESKFCQYLDKTSSKCSIHVRKPLSCSFETIRFVRFPDKYILSNKGFGRAWAMTRTDGQKGTLCEFVPPSRESIPLIIAEFGKLTEWADYFNIATRIAEILRWCEEGPHQKPILLP